MFAIASMRIAVLMVFMILAGCAVNPAPVSREVKDRLAEESRERLFANQEPITEPLTLYQATARAIKSLGPPGGNPMTMRTGLTG